MGYFDNQMIEFVRFYDYHFYDNKKDSTHTLNFEFKCEKFFYRYIVRISNEFEVKSILKTYLYKNEQLPRSIDKFNQEETLTILLPLLESERLRIITKGFPLKKFLKKHNII